MNTHDLGLLVVFVRARDSQTPKHKEFIVNIWFGLEEAKPLLHHPNPNVNLNFDVTFGWVELRSHPKVNQNLMLTLVVGEGRSPLPQLLCQH